MKRQAALLGLTLLAACGRSEPSPAGNSDQAAASSLAAGSSRTAFDTPAAQRRNPTIDPAGPQAAREAVALYYKAIANRQYDLAQAFWAAGPMRAEDSDLFASRFAGEQKVGVEVGQPVDAEGAAGSAYISVPVIVRGVPALAPDRPYALHRLVVLRRVNDVPGSSASDRQWHIHEVRDVAAGPEGTPRPIAF